MNYFNSSPEEMNYFKESGIFFVCVYVHLLTLSRNETIILYSQEHIYIMTNKYFKKV